MASGPMAAQSPGCLQRGCAAGPRGTEPPPGPAWGCRARSSRGTHLCTHTCLCAAISLYVRVRMCMWVHVCSRTPGSCRQRWHTRLHRSRSTAAPARRARHRRYHPQPRDSSRTRPRAALAGSADRPSAQYDPGCDL